MKDDNLENISNLIKNSREMLIIGFVDKTNVVDNLITERLMSVLKSLNYKVTVLEYDAGLIGNNYNYFNIVTIPTYNIYYNNVLLEQLDLLDNSIEMKRKLSFLTIN